MTTMSDRYQSDFARRYVAEGKTEGRAEGEAKSVLKVLDTRAVDVPDKVRAEIADCTDLAQLDIWLRRAVTATSIGDVDDRFAG